MRRPLLLGILLFTVPAFAANLLTNPRFDSNINGWTASGPSLIPTWNTSDALGSPTSGAANLRNVFEIANNAGPSLLQCVPATGGAEYDLGARVHIPEGQSRTGFVQVYVRFFPNPGCTGEFISSAHAGVVQAPARKFVAIGNDQVIAPPTTQSAQVNIQLVKNQPGGEWIANVDDVYFGPAAECLPTLTDLCLSNGRFRVRTAYNTTNGANGSGQAVQLTADSGYFWFFNADNVEMIVKVLRGCDINNRYWVFAGGLTNVSVVMTVTDTNTDQHRTYTNPQITAFQPIQDTSAFATCP